MMSSNYLLLSPMFHFRGSSCGFRNKAGSATTMAILRTIGLWVFSVAPWCISGVPATAMAKQIFRPPASLQALSAEHCPASCRDIFPRLKCNGDCAGGMEHYVEVQERGGEHLGKLTPSYVPTLVYVRYFTEAANTWEGVILYPRGRLGIGTGAKHLRFAREAHFVVSLRLTLARPCFTPEKIN